MNGVSSTTPTICFFNSSKAWGGGEKWHYDISTRLSHRQYRVVVITNKSSELALRFQPEALTVYNLRVTNLSFLNVLKVIAISRILKKEGIQSIIVNLPSDLKVAGLAAKLAKVPQIIYRRGSAIPIKNTILNRFLFKHVITEVIANSQETQNTILQHNPNLISPGKIHIIYNGIDLEHHDQLSGPLAYHRKHREIILGNTGRLVEQKGQKYLIEIAHILKSRDIPFKLLIAGAGPLEADLKHRAKQLGVEHEVVFLGFVSNTKCFMESIDIFLLTSIWEGFGYVLIEAMASQKPVIAFNTSSNSEIVEDQNTGFLVNGRNLEEFVDKIELLYGNPELCQELGQKGRKRVEDRFEIGRATQQVEKLLGNAQKEAKHARGQR